MELFFEKYHGTGNDFVMVDHRFNHSVNHNDKTLIKHICDRRFGIGADGLILLEKSEKYDFKMVYFNADGCQSTMCGNGGRCLVQFAKSLDIFDTETIFEAIDGEHYAKINSDGTVSLQMIDVPHILQIDERSFELNTGSPHFISFLDTLPENIKEAGSKIRFSAVYKMEGINVNFVKNFDDYIEVATYERGVEDETLSCGTGVTAAALSYAFKQNLIGKSIINIKTKGGNLTVSLVSNQNHFSDIWLNGPAVKVFKGSILL